MKLLKLQITQDLISPDVFSHERIQESIIQAQRAIKKKYETPYGFLYCPEDDTMLMQVTQLAEQCNKLNPSALFVIGIGGSNLGAQAAIEALYGKYYNYQSQKSPKLKIWFVDTIDQNYTQELLERAQQELKAGNTILVNIISKSGSTTEVLVNSALFLELLTRYYTPEKLKQSVIITTDKDSKLWQYAAEKKYMRLEIPQEVGGRYSVFTAAGLFPLALLGVDIAQFCAGAFAMRDKCLQDHGLTAYLTSNNSKNGSAENPAAQSAEIMYQQHLQHKNIIDTFIFAPGLAQLGSWYRQLVSESLGKKENIHGAVTHVGLTPITTIGTTDLHSATQLALAGPSDKFTVFVTIESEESSNKNLRTGAEQQKLLRVPVGFVPASYKYLENKSITEIKQAIVTGVQKAYTHEKRPFITIELPELSAASLGQFMMLKMCEIVYLGNLLEINPFDQPAVELYKSETRKILSKN